jgi:hypothetical protein
MKTWITAVVVALAAVPGAIADSPLEISPAPAGVEVRAGVWRAVGARVTVDRKRQTLTIRGGAAPAALYRDGKGRLEEVRARTIILNLADNTVRADGAITVR